MSAFHEVQFPAVIGRGARGGPMRRTQVVTLGSGHEERNTAWAASRHSYDVSYGIRNANDLHTLKGFFEARRGRLHGFRFKDWADYKSCPPMQAVSPDDQSLGSGNGTVTQFALRKRYGSDPLYWRTITKPVAGTVRVQLDGVEQMSGWTVNTATGVITFDTAPASGVQVRAGFEFDVPVRFDTDELQAVLDHERVGNIPSIPLVELRV